MKKESLVKKGLLLGVGMAAYVQEKTEKFARDLVRKGYLDKAEGKRLVRSMYQEADKSRKKIAGVMEKELKLLLKKVPKLSKKKPAWKKAVKKKAVKKR